MTNYLMLGYRNLINSAFDIIQSILLARNLRFINISFHEKRHLAHTEINKLVIYKDIPAMGFSPLYGAPWLLRTHPPKGG